ncbi:MAG TPA: hypothetical protein VIG24_04315 [Acidimicrobiia bacterium]
MAEVFACSLLDTFEECSGVCLVIFEVAEVVLTSQPRVVILVFERAVSGLLTLRGEIPELVESEISEVLSGSLFDAFDHGGGLFPQF